MKKILTIDEINKLPTTECKCPECTAMCEQSRPCWGTPDEIKVLLDKGYAKQLMCDYYEGDLNGSNMEYTEIITPALVGNGGLYAPFWPTGRCALLSEDGLCSIHSMKPVEGRVCDHHHTESAKYIHASLVYQWRTKNGKNVVKLWKELT